MAKPSRFLPDRFDDIPEDKSYVGLRRVKRPATYWLVPLGIVVGVSAVLTAAGLFLVDRSDDYLELSPEEIALETPEPEPEPQPEPEPEPEPEPVEPIVNPSTDEIEDLTVTILNGTDTAGLAAGAGELLDAEGWPEQTLTNADSQDVETSLVAYGSDEDEGLARGVAQILGIDEVIETNDYPGARITVLLGADYSQD